MKFTDRVLAAIAISAILPVMGLTQPSSQEPSAAFLGNGSESA